MPIDKKTITIELIQHDEYQQWLPLWQSYQHFYQVTLSELTTKITWQRFFDTNEPLYCAVAKMGNELIGFTHFVFHRSTWAEKNFCYLEDLFVAPNIRGRQVGKQLIDYVKRQALDQQCARLYWHTQETNSTAQKLYDWVAEKPGVIEYRMAL
ncbi:GNAT family N-acetyltransferase [Moellerella wisconsensis]|uniref:GNAT family N-acetyltransferase n=2 Tax=Moellerella wisconsensis TaxID=158849 RepID=A0A9Q8Q2N2_9GAMM|nr:GNAT family N-acetyltransferase [Moellerella wisconsensis]KLN98184.1 GNAT family acetyltransferase [Moellerella wisconsensis]UNH25319.1 GNAT family N-acetyltransferase [Moellerella wisconsensis]UNH28504.1 GNAT family N-acetyltransferase [Moellerella wisconsensis]UNH31959.1 GNAT family N-acetyltransferase [Moellerella wisconsensis]UNH40069.1 GNAT family N-acetyltransferase [Moellerella wisconsensis]